MFGTDGGTNSIMNKDVCTVRANAIPQTRPQLSVSAWSS